MQQSLETVERTSQDNLINDNKILQDKSNSKAKKDKLKLIFFVKQGLDSFLENIINVLSQQYETKKIIVTEYNQIDEGMQWADICWFECCDELILYGSKHALAYEKKIICRVYAKNTFTRYINDVNWDCVDKVIVVAEYIRNTLMKKINIEKSKCEVIYNGVDLNTFKFKKRQKGFNIAYLADINYEKGSMMLLQTFKTIHDKDNRYNLYICGNFYDERDVLYYDQMVKEFGLEKNIFYNKKQGDLNRWLEDKDYILCTSVLESQNMNIIEAMCKGIKPIIHNFVGAKEIYPSKYIWNTVNEAVKMIFSNQYSSEEYADFVANKFSLENINIQVKELVNRIENAKEVSNEEPLVTVGILNCCYEKNINECINSVLNQTYKNIEIIIVDDFSIDNSREIIKKYEEEFKNIKGIYHEKNDGSTTRAKKEIIKASSGEYFMFLCGNDFLADKNVIKVYSRQFILNQELDFVYGNIKTYNENKSSDLWKYRDYTDDELISGIFNQKGVNIIPLSLGLFKKEFYKRNNLTWFEDEDNAEVEDTLNALINLKYSWKRKYIDYNIICYRNQDDNKAYDLEKKIKSNIAVMEYIVNNFSETRYLGDIIAGEKNDEIKKCKKNYLIGINYYNAFAQYLNDANLRANFDIQQIIEFSQPIIYIIQNYMKKSLNHGKLYIETITKVLDEIKKFKIDININKNSKEYILQSEIVNKGAKLKTDILEKYNYKYKNKKIKVLIYSASNGYWKYSFTSWKQVFNHMGIQTDIVYEINSNLDYSSYDVFITIAGDIFINNCFVNKTIYNIKNKIGILTKEIDNDRLDLLNIKLTKEFNFQFLITTFHQDANSGVLHNWIENEISIVNIMFGFNPLILYPENSQKIYDYFFVGTNSFAKVKETKEYLAPIFEKYSNGILRGTGWGENIIELKPNNTSFFYNRSKINLNYHLDMQKNFISEINERTFSIAACGAFQLVDKPKAISRYYTENDIAIANDTYEYMKMFEHYLNNPLERLEKSYNSLVKTYEKEYSLFNILEKVLKQIM